MITAAERYRLQRLLVFLPMLGDDGSWLANFIRSQIANAPDRMVRLSVRAQLIQELAACYPGRSTRRAKDMAQDGRRYAATCWPRARRQKTQPAHHRDRREAILFKLHRNAELGGAKWPLAWRSLTTILQFTAVATATDLVPSSPQAKHGEGTMKPVEFDELLRVKLPGPLCNAVSEAAAQEAETASHFVRRALIAALRERGVDLAITREEERAA